jgi:NAD(P)-dependent dehydrogenase (short-subunit alcohol dehydrogenase family)
MAGRLKGKHALVTGGTMGIGEAIVRLFAAEGARVLTVARHDDLGSALARELAPAVTFRVLDVTDDPGWASLAAEFAHDPFDVLVNNAGGLHFAKKLLDCELSEWRLELEVNLTGPFLAMRYLLPPMLKLGHGSIINVASMSGLRAQPDAPAYQAAKAGLRWLTKNAALSYAATGVRINTVNPGVIATPLQNSQPTGREQWFYGRIPMDRRGTAAEVAWAALFLASDESSYVTGIDLQVDGGYEI